MGPKFGAQFWAPKMWAQFWAPIWGPDLGPQFGAQGKMVCGRMGFPKGGMGDPKGEMQPNGVTNPLGRPVSPLTPPEKMVYRDVPHFPKKNWAPLAPCGDPYGALCGPLSGSLGELRWCPSNRPKPSKSSDFGTKRKPENVKIRQNPAKSAEQPA